jgi:membrane fusion protein, copper/silver efflux system
MIKRRCVWILVSLMGLFFLNGRNAFALDPKTESIMDGILEHYLVIQGKLASDTTAGIEAEAQKIAQKTAEFLDKPCRPDEIGCAGLIQKMRAAASRMKGSDIKILRENFLVISQSLEEYWREFNPHWQDIFVFRCPMANENKGAPWLQKGSDLQNPYFGKAMSSCGTPLQK